MYVKSQIKWYNIKMVKKFFLIFFLIFITILFIPDFAFAQECGTGMVPCGGPGCTPCTLCDFFLMIQRVINYALTRIVPAITALMIVIAGAMMVSAYAGQSGPDVISRVKKFLGSLIIGLLVVYLAWVIVNMFLMSIGVAEWTGLRNWWEIQCETEGLPPDQPRRTFCGDGIAQALNDDFELEECDGNDFPMGRNCFIYTGRISTKEVTCSNCRVDTSSCEEEPPDAIEGCMDMAAMNRDPDATVDDGSCLYCGNGAVDLEQGEVCDGFNMGGETCITQGYFEGEPLLCQNDCMAYDYSNCSNCGNGVIGAGETCDPAAPLPSCVPNTFIPSCNPDTCLLNCAAPPIVEGCTDIAAINWNSEATIDDGSCLYCGNGAVDFSHGEVCDGFNMGGKTCADFGLAPGILNCLEGSNCLEFDPSGCGEILPSETGDMLFNCHFPGGARLNRLAGFDGSSVYLLGLWSVNRVNSTDGTNWQTTCQPGWTGTASDQGWKNLDEFAATHADGNYIAFAGFDGSYLFFSVINGEFVINQDICSACPDNIDGICDKDTCLGLGDSCRNIENITIALIYSMAGYEPNMCVAENQCELCGTVNYNICSQEECSAIGPACVYNFGTGNCTAQ